VIFTAHCKQTGRFAGSLNHDRPLMHDQSVACSRGRHNFKLRSYRGSAIHAATLASTSSLVWGSGVAWQNKECPRGQTIWSKVVPDLRTLEINLVGGSCNISWRHAFGDPPRWLRRCAEDYFAQTDYSYYQSHGPRLHPLACGSKLPVFLKSGSSPARFALSKGRSRKHNIASIHENKVLAK
jgi:hypothetical protein